VFLPPYSLSSGIDALRGVHSGELYPGGGVTKAFTAVLLLGGSSYGGGSDEILSLYESCHTSKGIAIGGGMIDGADDDEDVDAVEASVSLTVDDVSSPELLYKVNIS